MPRKLYGVQFHPEVVHTPDGAKLIANFVHRIAGCPGDWIDGAVPRHRGRAHRETQVGERPRDLRAVGRASTPAVAALLIHEAIGDQLTCIFVDHGLLRAERGRARWSSCSAGHYNIPLVAVDAGARFLDALAGVTDPEEKRKTIGRLFVDVFEEEAEKIGAGRFPRARHALSRRDRERVVLRRAVGDHQVATTMSADCPSACS